MQVPPAISRHIHATLFAACLLPTLLAYNLTPSATLFNQLLSLGGWGLVLLLLRPAATAAALRSVAPLLFALLLLALAGLSSPALNGLPWSLALSGAALPLAAAAVLLLAASLGDGQRRSAWACFCWALLAMGLASLAVSLVQVFVPVWADGELIARSGIAGRAVGNLRQPNHLASLLMWACVAAVWLSAAGRLGRRAGWMLTALLFGLVFGVVLSASRTGIAGILLLLPAWGLLDRRLARHERLALLATPLMLAVSWGLMWWWAHAGGHAFGAESRLAEGAGSPSRLAILANAWALLKAHPWSGVGFGEFNLAWTLTPFPQRPTAFFDHTHNLIMQLLVELGWPLGLLVLGLLLWALWRALLAAVRASHPDEARLRRSAFMVLLAIGGHSIVEYPLWYAYFLLPTAFAAGMALGGRRDEKQDAPAGRRASGSPPLWLPSSLLPLTGALLVAGCLYAVWDYLQVVEIYVPPQAAAPLEQRIARGQRSLFFSTQGDYAAATSLPAGPATLAAAQRTGHNLIDVRLMMAWAKSLAASGEVDRARYLAARLREFRSREGEAWLTECDRAAAGAEPPPFQCQPPSRDYSYQEMR